jgi:hypothetical protein
MHIFLVLKEELDEIQGTPFVCGGAILAQFLIVVNSRGIEK